MKISFSPLQLFTPLQLFFCLILFFLPWIELQCSLPPEMLKSAPKGELEQMKKDGLDPNKPISMATQSGLQIATGGSSPSPDMEKFAKSMGKGMGAEPETKSSSKKKDDDVGSAPLMFLFPVALLAGLAIGCVPVQHLIRRLVLAACCLGALGVVGIQVAIGFPLEKEIAKQKEQMKGMGGMMGGGAVDPKGAKTKTETKEPDIFRVSWKIPLYLTFLFLLGATVTSFVDGSLLAMMKPKPKRRYGTASDDDEDEEEDDRPKKKKKPVVDEDEEEDDRPRKKKKPVAEDLPDEEEEERPRKKKAPPPPVEEAEEIEEVEEKPRKKSPPAASAPPPPAGGNPFDFGADEPPKKKPKRRDDDEDEDDRPRKKKRRDDD